MAGKAERNVSFVRKKRNREHFLSLGVFSDEPSLTIAVLLITFSQFDCPWALKQSAARKLPKFCIVSQMFADNK